MFVLKRNQVSMYSFILPAASYFVDFIPHSKFVVKVWFTFENIKK